jgi:hypothetical protein
MASCTDMSRGGWFVAADLRRSTALSCYGTVTVCVLVEAEEVELTATVMSTGRETRAVGMGCASRVVSVCGVSRLSGLYDLADTEKWDTCKIGGTKQD